MRRIISSLAAPLVLALGLGLLGPSAPATAAPAAPAPAAGTAPAPAGVHFTGYAFDACTAPSLSTLRAWWGRSPYRALGIYIDGSNRACRQPRLTADWVREATRIGWKLLPVQVGSQARCTMLDSKRYRIDPQRAAAQGRAEGASAVRAARALGIRPGSPIHLDMEAYDRRDRGCAAAVLRFSAAWYRAARASGYLAGFYSSADSGIADLVDARRSGRAAGGELPDVLWYARWDNRAATTGDRAVPEHYWRNARVHQYRGNVRETYGGASMNIDRNAVNAPVAVVS